MKRIILQRSVMHTVLLGVAFLLASNVFGQKKSNTIYAFTIGTCFNDSVNYISSIQPLTEGISDNKTKFLNDRQTYSNRMKTYLDQKTGKTYTCAVFFNKNRNKLEKTYLKLRRNASKDAHIRLIEIPVSEFRLSEQ